MPKSFRRDLGMDTLGEQHSRVRVPEVMETHGPEARSAHEPPYSGREGVRVDRGPVTPVEDVLAPLPRLPKQEPTLGLLPVMPAQGIDREPGEPNRPARPVGLGLNQD